MPPALFDPKYQLADLFRTDRTSVGRHIRNIYASGELERHSTCAKIAQVQTEGARRVIRLIDYYNLDVIISMGYRVNSRQATAFQRWTTGVLKNYLLQGYAVSEHIRRDNFNELRQLVQVLGRAVWEQETLTTDESRSLMEKVVYTYPLKIKENGGRTPLIFLPGYGSATGE